jgi:hypothetical protein
MLKQITGHQTPYMFVNNLEIVHNPFRLSTKVEKRYSINFSSYTAKFYQR